MAKLVGGLLHLTIWIAETGQFVAVVEIVTGDRSAYWTYVQWAGRSMTTRVRGSKRGGSA